MNHLRRPEPISREHPAAASSRLEALRPAPATMLFEIGATVAVALGIAFAANLIAAAAGG